MNTKYDEAKLTAYALGELEGADRAEVERWVEGDDEARRFVDEVRATAWVVSQELRAARPTEELLPIQRLAIERQAGKREPELVPLRHRMLGWAAGAAAAVAMTAGIWMANRPPKPQADKPGTPATTQQVVVTPKERQTPPGPRPSTQLSTNDKNWVAVTGTVNASELEMVPLEYKMPKPAYLGTPRHIPAGVRLAPDDPMNPNRQVVRGPLNVNGGALAPGVDAQKQPQGLDRHHHGETHPDHNTEAYDPIADNPFLRVLDNPLSTFSIDVDTASYSNVRRFLTSGSLPPKDAVRIEELLNYFPYSDPPPPPGGDPFAANVEVADCPWEPTHRLARVALKARTVDESQRPAANLVFLIDVSGSMNESNKLPLVKQSMRQLLAKLKNTDKVSIVVYAGAAGVVLPPTACGENMGSILAALDNLEAGGSTNGGQGIELAYRLATETFIKDGINRVILATDGDFNVGVTNQGDLTRLIEAKAKSGVYLSVLGFGMGNVKDSTMEKLADKGNGNYAYIDSPAEARKVLVEQAGGTLITVAKDVKIQVEFNPARVAGYRLVGYENRILAKEDFNDDRKDAGEIGSGHSVVALYELVPAGAAQPAAVPVDELRYQKVLAPPADVNMNELMTVKMRYKQPDGDVSKKLEFPVAAADGAKPAAHATEDFRFSAAVAQFGMLLRESPHKGASTFRNTLELARQGIGPDAAGHRREFVELVEKASTLTR